MEMKRICILLITLLSICSIVDVYGNSMSKTNIDVYNSVPVLPTTSKDISGIRLNKTSLVIYEGETFVLSAETYPNNLNSKQFVWTSSNSSVVSIDKNGKVTANAPGVASVTVEVEGKTATCTIVVKSLSTSKSSVALNKTYSELSVGESETLVAVVFPQSELNNVVWTSNDESIVSVENGVIRANSEGAASITATLGDKYSVCTVLVNSSNSSANTKKADAKIELPQLDNNFSYLVEKNNPNVVAFSTTITSQDMYATNLSTGISYKFLNGKCSIFLQLADDYMFTVSTFVDGVEYASEKFMVSIESNDTRQREKELWKALTGGPNFNKKWKLDIIELVTKTVDNSGKVAETSNYISQYFHNPIDFYGDVEAGGSDNDVWGYWGGSNVYDWNDTPEIGTISFDGTTGKVQFVLDDGVWSDGTSVKEASERKGVYEGFFSINISNRDPNFLTLTDKSSLWDNIKFLTGIKELSKETAELILSDNVRFPMDKVRVGNQQFSANDLKNVMIMHCSDNSLIIRVKRLYNGYNNNGTLKYSPCWVCYHYIVDNYDYGKIKKSYNHTSILNTTLTVSDLVGTWKFADQTGEWYDWAKKDVHGTFNANTEVETFKNWGVTNTSEKYDAAKKCSYTFFRDGTYKFIDVSYNGSEEIVRKYSGTYKLSNGYLSFSSNVAFTAFTNILSLSGSNMYTCVTPKNVSSSIEKGSLWIAKNNGSKEESVAVQLVKEVESSVANKLESGLWKSLTGGSKPGFNKKWKLDIEKYVTQKIDDSGNVIEDVKYVSNYFHNPIDFYGDSEAGGSPNDSWGYWGGTNIYEFDDAPEIGTISFDGTTGKVQLAMEDGVWPNGSSRNEAIVRKGIYEGDFTLDVSERDPYYLILNDGTTLWDNIKKVSGLKTMSDEVAKLTLSSNIRFPMDKGRVGDQQFLANDLRNLTIIHCSDSSLIVRVKRTYKGFDTDKNKGLVESSCWVCYHYIVDGYDYGSLKSYTHSSILRTDINASDLVGTWKFAPQTGEWYSWAKSDVYGTFNANSEVSTYTNWGATDADKKYASTKKCYYTFNSDGSFEFNDVTYNGVSEITAKYYGTYTVSKGYITLSSDVNISAFSDMLVISGRNMYTCKTPSNESSSIKKGSLWIGQNSGQKEETRAVQLIRVK